MPIVKELIEALDLIKQLHEKKNNDYASPTNPFSNFDVSEYGLKLFPNPRDGAFVWPIFTKLARLSTLLNPNRSDAPNNESVEDSMIDIATYILLWRADRIRRKQLKTNDLAGRIPGLELNPNHPWVMKDSDISVTTPLCAQCGAAINLGFILKFDLYARGQKQKSLAFDKIECVKTYASLKLNNEYTLDPTNSAAESLVQLLQMPSATISIEPKQPLS